LIVIASGCSQIGRNEEQLGNQLSDFDLMDLNGNPIASESLTGKRVFLNIWATWCRPCIEEMPSIAAAQDELKDSNVIFVLASGEDSERIKKFRDHFGIKLQFAHFKNMDDFYIRAIPVTYLFDEAGKLIYTEYGSRDWSTAASREIILQEKND
jgi:thiol-disulfide isomerase/thioredoxin